MALFVCLVIIAAVSQASPAMSQGLALLGEDVVVQGTDIVVTFSNYTKTWENFLSKYSKSYGATESLTRFSLFKETLTAIEAHNKLYSDGNTMHWLALNEFADWTKEEKAFLTGTKISPESLESRQKRAIGLGSLCNALLLPPSVDWRNNGTVTAVKNQKKCGSCWAFSVAGSLEGQRQRITSDSIGLSVQQLVDCDTSNSGCNGGSPASAFAYLQQKGGIMTADAYPYTSLRGSCTFNKSEVAATVEEYTFVRPSKDECALKKTIAEVGPISMAAHITNNFYYYGGGVFTDKTCRDGISSLNHAMLLVGYGVEKGTDYWIIKNSWGSGWGEHGYIRIISDGSNQCGVATYTLYPEATAKNVTATNTSFFNRPAAFCTFLCSLLTIALFC